MEAYNRSSHAVYRCEYHFVWVPEYRYDVLVREVKPRLKEILVELCNWLDITIIEGAICSDHVHMHLSVSATKACPVSRNEDSEGQKR